MNQTWPASRFFWSVLEAPGAALRSGPVPPGLLAEVEEDLPLPPDEVWAVGAEASDGRFVVCAARRSDLTGLRPGTLRLTPQSVPGFAGADPEVFNLLVGEFEPGEIRRIRRRGQGFAAVIALLGACLIGVGLSRRAGVWTAEANTARATARAVVAALAPSALWTKEDLAMELLQKQQAVPAELKAPGDASLTLSSLIAGWPTQTPAKAQSVSVTGDSASLSVTVPGDPAAFLASFRAPEGWRLEEPRLTGIEKATRLTLELRRSRP